MPDIFKNLQLAKDMYPWHRQIQYKIRQILLNYLLGGKKRFYIVTVQTKQGIKVLGIAWGENPEQALNNAEEELKIQWNAARLGQDQLTIYVCVETWGFFL